MINFALYPFRKHFQVPISPSYPSFQLSSRGHLQSHLIPIPRRKMYHSEHDPNIIRAIRLTAMPQPQVPDHNTSFRNLRLQWRAYAAASFQKLWEDGTGLTVAVEGGLLVRTGASVCTQPDLGGAVGRGERDQRDVDDEGEGDGGVCEVGIAVDRLGLGAFGHGRVAGDEADISLSPITRPGGGGGWDKRHLWPRPQNRIRYLNCEWILPQSLAL
jgi:hypothetical protein